MVVPLSEESSSLPFLFVLSPILLALSAGHHSGERRESRERGIGGEREREGRERRERERERERRERERERKREREGGEREKREREREEGKIEYNSLCFRSQRENTFEGLKPGRNYTVAIRTVIGRNSYGVAVRLQAVTSKARADQFHNSSYPCAQ